MKNKTDTKIKWAWFLTAVLILFCAPNLFAYPYTAITPQILVTANNTLPNQQAPAIAVDSNGNFVIVWQSANQEASGWGIYGQRYNSSFAPQGGEIHINSWTTDNQARPDVAMDSNGDFVVVWDSMKQQDVNYTNVFGQRYNANGTPAGSEFRVNTFVSEDQNYPAVAMDSAGNFAVTWQSSWQDAWVTEAWYGIFAQRYNANGTTAGNEFHVNTFTQGNQLYPDIAMDANGNFVIVYQSDISGAGVGDGSYEGIFGQRFAASGAKVGGEFLVNTYTTYGQTLTRVAMIPGGGFVAVWESPVYDGRGGGIYAQIFDANGVKVGSEIHVNTTAGWGNSGVAVGPNGEIIFSWYSGDDVYARVIGANGQPLVNTFMVNIYTTNPQNSPEVAVSPKDGTLLFTWAGQNVGSFDPDGVALAGYKDINNNGPGVVPEPATVISALLGLAGFAIRKFRKA